MVPPHPKSEGDSRLSEGKPRPTEKLKPPGRAEAGPGQRDLSFCSPRRHQEPSPDGTPCPPLWTRRQEMLVRGHMASGSFPGLSWSLTSLSISHHHGLRPDHPPQRLPQQGASHSSEVGTHLPLWQGPDPDQELAEHPCLPVGTSCPGHSPRGSEQERCSRPCSGVEGQAQGRGRSPRVVLSLHLSSCRFQTEEGSIGRIQSQGLEIARGALGTHSGPANKGLWPFTPARPKPHGHSLP